MLILELLNSGLLALLVGPSALSTLAVPDHHLVRNVLVNFAALQLLADALSLLDAEAPLLLEVLLDVPLLNFFDFHEDTENQSQ